MAWEPKPGSASLFKNKFKKQDNHPDLRGDGICPLCKQALALAAWKKTTRNGDAFLSINMQEPREREDQPKLSDSDGVEDLL